MVSRFKDEIHLWNWDRIMESKVSCGGGPMGLGLKEEVPDYMDAFSYVLYNERTKAVQNGLSSQPKSMAPWKMTKLAAFSAQEEVDEYRSIFKRFFEKVSAKTVESVRNLRNIWKKHAQRYLEAGFHTVCNEFEESRYTVGAFHKTTRKIGDELETGFAEIFESGC
jgi:hypothetical protein